MYLETQTLRNLISEKTIDELQQPIKWGELYDLLQEYELTVFVN